jgi:hypothetical protein
MLHGARDGWIFRAQRGGYLCRSNFRSNWKRACAAAGLPALRVHDARHSHASWLANDPQTPLANVRDRLGHSSLAVTSRYVHVMQSDTDPCLAALERCMAALLLRQVINAGAPPSLARLPMTPDEVAASYDEASSEANVGRA